ncbi:MAG: peptidoglycan DD-metalloendopeptidase family protein [bacterium]
MPNSNIKFKRSVKKRKLFTSPLTLLCLFLFLGYMFWPYLAGTGAHDFYSEDPVGIDFLAVETPDYRFSKTDSPQKYEKLSRTQISRQLTPLRNYVDPFEQTRVLEFVKHEVRAGESLWAIARHYGRKIHSIASVNYSLLARLGQLPAGIKLRIPNRDGILTKLAPGQTMWDLMKTYDVDYRKILAFNDIKSTAELRRGMELFIPGAEPVNPYRYRFDHGSSKGNYIWPLPPNYRRITSGFGKRIHPILEREIHHTGIDIAAPRGTKAYASRAGRVNFVGYIGGYGKVIRIQHSSRLETFYAHLSDFIVRNGQYVEPGQPVGIVGTTGHVTGPHLHFEIRINETPVNPNSYLP